MKRIRTNPDRRRAFSLAELLMVILILGIAAAIVVPLAVDSSDLQALAAARMVAADLEYAQNAAITTQTPVSVTFSAAGNSYTLSNASGPLIHPMTKSAYVTNFATVDGFEQLRILSAAFGGSSTVTFDELGTPNNPGTVELQAGAGRYRVTVSAGTGRVTAAVSGS